MDADIASNVAGGDYRQLWAKSKPRHPLWKHLLDASAVSIALPPPLSDCGWERAQIAFLVGLHDIGKADSCFQHQIPGFSPELVEAGFPATADPRCRHERISARFVENMLSEEGLGACGQHR